MTPTYRYAARVERVVDGDTIDVALDLGMRVHLRVRLRVEGIDTPEKNATDPDEREAAVAAWRYVEALVQQYGDETLVETRKPDKYGRTLARIVLDPTGAALDLGPHLISAGFARPYAGGTR